MRLTPILCVLLIACDCGSPFSLRDAAPEASLDALGNDAISSDAPVVDESVTDNSIDGTSDSNLCDSVRVNSERRPPNALILLDESGSMRNNGGGDAAITSISSVAQQLQSSVAFGLAGFAGGRACGPSEVVVPPQLNSAAAIADHLSGIFFFGRTPTANAISEIQRQVVAGSLSNLDHIILITDGAPNCNASLNNQTCTCTDMNGGDCSLTNDGRELCLDDTATVNAISGLRALGITTHVIGFAVSNWATTLNQMATAGNPGASYLAVENAAQLGNELMSVSSGIGTCEFQLNEAPTDITFVRVRLNGVEVPHRSQRPGAGWNLVGDRTIVLEGADCSSAQTTPAATLEIDVECEPVFLI